MTSDKDSFDSSDLSEELVDDEFLDENAAPKRVDEKEESLHSFDWFDLV